MYLAKVDVAFAIVPYMSSVSSVITRLRTRFATSRTSLVSASLTSASMFPVSGRRTPLVRSAGSSPTPLSCRKARPASASSSKSVIEPSITPLTSAYGLIGSCLRVAADALSSASRRWPDSRGSTSGGPKNPPPTSRASRVAARKRIAAAEPSLRLQKKKSFVSARPRSASSASASTSLAAALAPSAAPSASASVSGGSAAVSSATWRSDLQPSSAYTPASEARRDRREPGSYGEGRVTPSLRRDAPGARTTANRIGMP